jgi:catalase
MSGVFQRLQESLNEAKKSATHKVNEIVTINDKILDMYPNTVNAHQTSNTMTTDHGTKIDDADHWLKITGNKGHGPNLLEDQIARERVCIKIPESLILGPLLIEPVIDP